MNVSDFISIAVVGATLSGVIQIIKTKFGTTTQTTLALTIVLSLIVGGVYVWLQATPYYQAVLGVLAAASTVYAVLIKPLES